MIAYPQLEPSVGRLGQRATQLELGVGEPADDIARVAFLFLTGIGRQIDAIHIVQLGVVFVQADEYLVGEIGVHHEVLCPDALERCQVTSFFAGHQRTAELYPDNLMYETDFPHPTSMSPGPATIAVHPREYAEEALGDLPGPVVSKLLHDNAAKVYHVD